MFNNFAYLMSAAALRIQEGPAETMSYFIAGYVIIFGTMALYLAGLIVRRRSLEQDLETLENIREKNR